MATIPPDLKFSSTHEWVRVADDVATIGISDHAQEELGEITYLDLTEVGRMLKPEEKFGEVESVKAVSELFSPVSGEIVEAHTVIADTPNIINADPFGEGWLIKVRLSEPGELAALMDAADYERFLEGSGH